MGVNLNLKSELVKRFGSQVEAAKQMGIRESKLSYIVRGHVQPSEREREALDRVLRGISVRLQFIDFMVFPGSFHIAQNVSANDNIFGCLNWRS